MSDYEIDREVVEQLKLSAKLRGPIEKVVLSADGKLVDGHQRKAADPDWPEEVNPKLKTEEDCLLFEIDKNWHRTNKGENWKLSRIERLARLGNTAKQISEKTGLPDYTVYRYYPGELKNKVKVEAGRIGGEVTGSAYKVQAESEDLREAEEKARLSRVECSNCHLGTQSDRITIIGGKSYCPGCAPTASLSYKREQKRLQQEKKKDQIAPGKLDSYEEKLGHMKTADPEVDRVLFARLSTNQELRDEGWRVEYHQLHFTGCIVDDVLLTNEKLSIKLAAFFDGSIHENRSEKDEKNRESAEHMDKELSTLTLPYKSASAKEFDRLFEAILEKAQSLKEAKEPLYADQMKMAGDSE
jgi:hypothetical protein